MSRILTYLIVAVLAVPVVATSQQVPLEAFKRSLSEVLTAHREPEVVARDHTCVDQFISCGETVSSTLTNHDCRLEGGTFADFWTFSGAANDLVTIDLTSSTFDPALTLLDPGASVAAFDDNGGGGTAAQIDGFQLATTSDQWKIGVSSVDPSQSGPYQLSLACETGSPPPPSGPCVADATTLCLTADRFRVSVDWRTPMDVTGSGTTVPLRENPDSGLFYFFNQENIELLVKVLDACDTAFNSFWVFAAATTNVEFTLTVTDTQAGAEKTYFNPLGMAAQPIQDTQAFATCP